jgi:twitching motility protein PilT
MSLEETGLPETVKELTRKSTGLVLIVGPTGSGKTTTMYAMIDFINRERRCKIVTVEDPVEYFHENRLSVIVQQEVGTDVPSFFQALIQILRQDPDVICIGEMRDLETIATALLAAETGHLVIATLHTGRAAETINRIIDAFPPYQQQQVRVQLAAVLEGIICQRLLPRVDKPGRVLAYEILLATPAIRSMIREGKPEAMINNVIEMSRSEGMVLLENCLRELYEQGIISYDVALAHAENPARIRD